MNRRYGRFGDGYRHNNHQRRSTVRIPRVFQNLKDKTEAGDSSYMVETIHSYMSYDKTPKGRVKISEAKLAQIQKLLDALPQVENVPYEDLQNSLFKQNFLEKRLGDMDQKQDFFMDKIERDPTADQLLFVENNIRLDTEEFLTMFDKRKRLPAFSKRNQILRMIEDNQVILLSGETGCGKTTQVPQFILDDFVSSYKGSLCKIVCTQPRRISAVSVARRVAAERGENQCGVSVGYQVRFEKVLPRQHGSILFVTNGIVIRHMESDPCLNNISHLILDEIHERDIHSDFLMALVKKLIAKRKDLKVILMSATLNEKRFKEYFDFCPHISIEGFSHKIEENYLEDIIPRLHFTFKNNMSTVPNERNAAMFLNQVSRYVDSLKQIGRIDHNTYCEIRKPCSEELNLDLIYELTIDIHRREEEGAILIFVTGFDDIRKLYDRLANSLSEEEAILVPLHSQIPIDQQQEVFEKAPPGVRKIVISTNIAETSITIDDVVYVIDSGWSKVKTYDARTKTENLEAKFISRANAVQRKGRAGRLKDGKCFRLYTKARFDCFYEFQKPEILRIRLEGIIMQLKILQLGKVRMFFDALLDQPKDFVIGNSLQLLYEIGALDDEEHLTPLGFYLAKLPIAPQLAKMLLYGVFFKCLEPILNIAVGLDYKSPFILNMTQNNHGDPHLIEFSEGVKSDHLLLHKAIHLYQLASKQERTNICKDYRLNEEVMEMLMCMKKEFMDHLIDLQLVAAKNASKKELNINSGNLELIKAIVCAGLFPNIAVAYPSTPRVMFETIQGNKCCIHKKSVVSMDRFFSCPFLTFYIRLKPNKVDMIFDVTICSPFSIIFFGNNFKVFKGMPGNTIMVNNMRFACEREVSEVLERLRDKMNQYLLFKMMNPRPFDLSDDENYDTFFKVVVDLLASPEG